MKESEEGGGGVPKVEGGPLPTPRRYSRAIRTILETMAKPHSNYTIESEQNMKIKSGQRASHPRYVHVPEAPPAHTAPVAPPPAEGGFRFALSADMDPIEIQRGLVALSLHELERVHRGELPPHLGPQYITRVRIEGEKLSSLLQERDAAKAAALTDSGDPETIMRELVDAVRALPLALRLQLIDMVQS